MAAPDPLSDSLLPSNDVEWNQGMVCINEALFTEQFRTSTTLGQFAKLCQAVHILRKVVHHVQEQKAMMTLVRSVQEALQLHSILEALHASLEPDSSIPERSLLEDVGCSLSAMAVCAAARLFLYNQYACNEPTAAMNMPRLAVEAEMQQLSLAGIKTLARRTVPRIAQHIVMASDAHVLEQVGSPALAHCLYNTATECIWFIKEDDDQEMVSGLQNIMNALTALGRTWRVCGKTMSHNPENDLQGKLTAFS